MDPKIGLRYRYAFSVTPPRKSILGEDSDRDDNAEELSTKEHSLTIYVPFTDQFTLILNRRSFSAEGREESDTVVSGGSLELRGYPGRRWSDRFGESTAVESRYTIPLNKELDIYIIRGTLDGLQLAAFYEAGQVSPQADNRLHEELHHSYGFGIRALLDAIVLRLDFGFSEEGSQTHLTIDQPF